MDAEGEVSVVPAENEESVLGGVCGITIGANEPYVSIPRSHSIMSLKMLEEKESRIHISVPDGYYVASLFLHSENFSAECDSEVSLLPYAVASSDSTALMLPVKCFYAADTQGMYLSKALLTGPCGSSYTLEIVLSPIIAKPGFAPAVSYEGGTYTNGTVCDLESELMPESATADEPSHTFFCESSEDKGFHHVVLSMPDALSDAAALNAQQAFSRWKLTYPNGSSLWVNPGEEIAPYTDCVLTAIWKDIYVVCIKANDLTVSFGAEIQPEYTVTYSNLPADGSLELSGTAVSCGELVSADSGASPLFPGAYSLSSSSAVICKNETGELLDSADYHIFYTDGQLTVLPLKLTVSACAPESSVYDGTLKTADSFTADGLYPGHSVASVKYTGGTLFGTGKAGIDADSVVVTDASGNDMRSCYEITAGADTVFTVSPCSSTVTVKAKSLEKQYDGTPLKAELGYEGEVTGLIGSDTLTVTEVSGSASAPGSDGVSRIVSVQITNGDTDVTKAYDNVVFTDGSLTVSKKPLTINAVNAEKYYDGQKLTASLLTGGGYTNGYKASGLISGHRITSAAVSGEGTSVGTYTTSVTASSVVIKDENGIDVTGFYSIKTVDGKLTIKQKTQKSIPLTITADSETWTYDGSEHSCRKYHAEGLVDGDMIDKVVFSVGSVQTDAGSAANVIESYVIKSSSGSIVPDSKYSVSLVPGVLTVEPFPITITAVSAEKDYDGSALVNKDVSTGKLANPAHTMDVQYDVMLDGRKTEATEVGTYEKQLRDVTIMSGDKDVTSNYSIKLVPGTLTVKAAPAGTTVNSNAAARNSSTGHAGLWITLLAVSGAALGAGIYIAVKGRKGSPDKKQP